MSTNFEKVTGSVTGFIQKLYNAGLFLYFSGIIATATILAILFPVIALPVIFIAAAVTVVSAYVLVALHNTVNGIFNLFQRKPQTAVVVTIADNSTIAPSKNNAHGVRNDSTSQIHIALAQNKLTAAKTVSTHENIAKANEVLTPKAVRFTVGSTTLDVTANLDVEPTKTYSPRAA